MLISQDEKIREKFQIELTIKEFLMLRNRGSREINKYTTILTNLILEELYNPYKDKERCKLCHRQ